MKSNRTEIKNMVGELFYKLRFENRKSKGKKN